MARRNQASASLKYSESSYTPYALHDWPIRDLKAEYTRLRDIAQKRLKRLRADPEGSQSRSLEIFPEGIPRISDMHGNRSRLESAMADLALFIRSPESTVSGVRSANRARARRLGISGDQPASVYRSLDEWMGIARAQGLLDIYGSEEAVNYYYDAGGTNLSAEDFERWVDRYDEWRAQRMRENTAEPGTGSDSLFGSSLGFF